MQIIQLDSKNLQSAYNILCQRIFPDTQNSIQTPFGLTYCEIEPFNKTAPHDHYDGETFLILSGQGRMRIADETQHVQSGSIIFIPNHTNHELENISKSENLKFVSIYWDAPAVSRQLGGNYLIFSAPPTPNGKLHVGHLSGPYFAADVLKRYLRLRGLNAVYCSGADENQTYVPAKAKQLNQQPLATANEFTNQILSILKNFNASPDFFQRPHADNDYQNYVQTFFLKLVENGTLKREENNYPFCNSCQTFVHESSVSGGCPHCNAKTNGNNCESCGLYNDCRDLTNPQCNLCGSACILKASSRFVFSFQKTKQRLQESLNAKHLSPRFKRYIDRLLHEGLADVTVTYPYSWGIEAPNQPGEIIYEWLEAAASYVYQAQKLSPLNNYDHYLVGQKSKVALSFGFDNSFFYAALIPALLWSFDSEIRYPDVFLTNYFYLFDQKKFSTSRNHAVWGDELLKTTKADVIRLYLAFTRPEQNETNFTLAEFETFVTEFGVQKLDCLLQTIAQFKNGTTNISSNLTEAERNYLERWNLLIHEAELSFNPQFFSLNHVFNIFSRYVSILIQFVNECEYSASVNIRVILAGLKGLAQIIGPICPEYSALIFKALNIEPKWMHHLDLPLCDCNFNQLPLTYFQNGLKHEREAV